MSLTAEGIVASVAGCSTVSEIGILWFGGSRGIGPFQGGLVLCVGRGSQNRTGSLGGGTPGRVRSQTDSVPFLQSDWMVRGVCTIVVDWSNVATCDMVEKIVGGVIGSFPWVLVLAR